MGFGHSAISGSYRLFASPEVGTVPLGRLLSRIARIASHKEGTASIKSFYESEATKGKATLEIITGIGTLLPQGNTYQLYLDCLKSLLHD
jgi:hypothetical protein